MVDKERIIVKNGGPRGGGEAQGVTDPSPPHKKWTLFMQNLLFDVDISTAL
jgi:hypothetical protein